MQQLRGKLAAVARRARTWNWAAASRVAAGLILCGISGAAGLAYAPSGAGPTEVVVVLGLGLGLCLLASGWASAATSDPGPRQPGPHQPDALARAAAADLGDYVRAYTGTWSVDRDR